MLTLRRGLWLLSTKRRLAMPQDCNGKKSLRLFRGLKSPPNPPAAPHANRTRNLRRTEAAGAHRHVAGAQAQLPPPERVRHLHPPNHRHATPPPHLRHPPPRLLPTLFRGTASETDQRSLTVLSKNMFQDWQIICDAPFLGRVPFTRNFAKIS